MTAESLPFVNPERRAAFQAASWPEREALHDAVAARKAAALDARRVLGRRYLERHDKQEGDGIVVPYETALRVVNLPAETAAAREEALGLAVDRESQANNRALEFPVLGRDFAARGPTLELASSPLIVAPIVRYFGSLPVLFNVFVSRAHTTERLENSAQSFHIDPEDVISHKVFIHLTDVDEGCGPLHALPADRSRLVLDAVDYREIHRITDERMDELAGWENVRRFCGPAGTVVFADTSRCLHFGGRPREAGKPLRYHLVFQYLLPTSYLFPLDGDSREPRHVPGLTATGDETWDALIGATLT